MSIRSWDPLRDLLTLQERMNRLFEESLGRGRLDGPTVIGTGSWSPLADVYETADAFVVQVELPGLSEDAVDVHIEADRLVLRGERRHQAGSRPEVFYRMERTYGMFTRSFQFAEGIDPERASAQFRDGLLRLELPKARPRPSLRSASERGD